MDEDQRKSSNMEKLETCMRLLWSEMSYLLEIEGA
jgi:hypothetical protein